MEKKKREKWKENEKFVFGLRRKYGGKLVGLNCFLSKPTRTPSP